MKIVFISDTHGLHWSVPTLPEADVFVHCGDFTNTGRKREEIESFNSWLATLPYPRDRKLICAGNHDIWFDGTHKESSPSRAYTSRLMITEGVYLQDQEAIIEGVKFYLSPWTPAFLGWGFNMPIGRHKEYWDKIPSNTDVLVTHGPPYGILDEPYRYNDYEGYANQYLLKPSNHCGCDDLKEAVERIRPSIHAFGHIHGGRGVIDRDTTYINAAFLNEQYHPYGDSGYVLVELNEKGVRILEK